MDGFWNILKAIELLHRGVLLVFLLQIQFQQLSIVTTQDDRPATTSKEERLFLLQGQQECKLSACNLEQTLLC